VSDDPLRDVVKRFRDLRVDVERLKSGRRSEGVLRIIRQVDEQLGFSDAVDVRLQDRLVDEQLGIDDAVTTTVETGGEFVADQSSADGDDRVG